jgi:hypothetical protein
VSIATKVWDVLRRGSGDVWQVGNNEGGRAGKPQWFSAERSRRRASIRTRSGSESAFILRIT